MIPAVIFGAVIGLALYSGRYNLNTYRKNSATSKDADGRKSLGSPEIKVEMDSDIQDECSAFKNQELLDLIERKNAEITDLHDRWLRSLADFDNFKKRVKRESDMNIHCAIRDLLESFLPIGDNLDRALNIASANSDDQIVKGLDMIRQSFHFALEKHGITMIQSVGCDFDPNFHEAIHQIESTEFGPGIIITEYEKGYIRDGKLLRPARVIVAKGDV